MSCRLAKEEMQFLPLEDIGETPESQLGNGDSPRGDKATLRDTPGVDSAPHEHWLLHPSADDMV